MWRVPSCGLDEAECGGWTGLGIETDRIGAEGRPYEDENENGDEEVDKGRDSFVAKRLLADGGRMARSQPPLVGRMIRNVWTMGVETSEKETLLDEIDTSCGFSRHNS